MTQNLVNDLNAHHYDLIFCSHPQKENGLTFKTVHRENLVLIVPQNHGTAGFDSVNLEQTLPYPYVYFAESSGIRYEVDKMFQVLGKRPRIAYEIVEDQVTAGLVAHGFGIAIVPRNGTALQPEWSKSSKFYTRSVKRNIYMVSSDQFYMPAGCPEFP